MESHSSAKPDYTAGAVFVTTAVCLPDLLQK